MYADILFSLKISLKTKKKKVFVVRNEAPHFLEALGFSLLSLPEYVNPVLSILDVNISTCAACCL